MKTYVSKYWKAILSERGKELKRKREVEALQKLQREFNNSDLGSLKFQEAGKELVDLILNWEI
jgi:hypothetical protein